MPACARKHRVALLDVNVLVALAWPNHEHHRAARQWFDGNSDRGWATTPVTEAGFVRVSSNRAAQPTAATPTAAVTVLERMTAIGRHVFLPDDVRLVVGGSSVPLPARYREVTDAHLLALAARHEGCLVTFDAGISALLGTVDATVLELLGADRG